MYMKTYRNAKSKRFAKELKIVEVLRQRLKAGDGWTRITMKDDGQIIDIAVTVDNKYLVTFPPTYDAWKRDTPYAMLNKTFGGLDTVAEFLLDKGWQKRKGV